MNVGVALREFLLEGFLVARELGGGGVGGRLVGVSAVTADVDAVVILAAVAVPAVVVALAAVPVSASALVAVRAPAVIALVVALVAAAIPAGDVAASVFS